MTSASQTTATPAAIGSRAREPAAYLGAAAAVLANGGSALDAAEQAVRVIEEDPTDHGVGLGGMPNRDGDVELDASIMDGSTLRCGAVGALRNYSAAITVARAVLERLPHVLITGEGAAELAAEIGLTRCDLLTDEARRAWEEWRVGDLSSGNLEHPGGTVDVLTLDARGHMASAVSTSGWAWKYPGRIGDSGVVGAGSYADDRFGAAACTGFGEAAMLGNTARAAVAVLQEGATPEEAARATLLALKQIPYVHDTDDFEMTVIVLTPQGKFAGASTAEGKRYSVWTPDGGVEVLPRAVVPLR